MTWEDGCALLVVGSLFFFIYLANSFKQDKWFHHAVKMLLFMLSLWVSYIGGSLAVEFARANTASTGILVTLQMFHNVMLYTAIITTILFVIYFLYELFMAYSMKKSKDHDSILGR